MKKIYAISFFALFMLSANRTVFQTPIGSNLIVACGEYWVEVLDQSTGLIYNSKYVATLDTAGLNGTTISMIWCSAHDKFALSITGDTLFAQGLNSNGSCGNGTTSSVSKWTAILTDSGGAAWPGIGITVIGMAVQYQRAEAWTSDGKLWVWGNTSGGARGLNATYQGSTANTRPVQVIFRSGALIKKVADANGLFAVSTADSVYSWGGSGANMGLGSSSSTIICQPTAVTLPAPSDDVDATFFNAIFVHLTNGRYGGWGFNQGMLGIGPPGDVGNQANFQEYPLYGGYTSFVYTDTAWNLPDSIMRDPVTGFMEMACSWTGTYFITQGDSLWYMGDKFNGSGGDGVQYPFSLSSYAWTWPQNPGLLSASNLPYSFNQRKPTLIAAGIKFVAVWTNPALTDMVYAKDIQGNIYAWGRGKSGYLSDQRAACDAIYGTVDANAPNSFDGVWPCRIDLNAWFDSTTYTEYSPLCIAQPSNGTCTHCSSIPSVATVSPAINVIVSGSNVTLDASASSNTGGYAWFRFVWVCKSGGGPTFSSTNPVETIYNLPNGSYQYASQAIDIRFDQATSTSVSFTITGSNPYIPNNYLLRKRLNKFIFINN